MGRAGGLAWLLVYRDWPPIGPSWWARMDACRLAVAGMVQDEIILMHLAARRAAGMQAFGREPWLYR